MKTTQLKDALANNSRLIEDIVGIPSNFKTSKISTDNIFIMYHRNSDNNPLMINPLDWSNYQNSGEIADGVVVVEGGKILVVGPTETNLYWSSRAINGGGKTTGRADQTPHRKLHILNVMVQVTHRDFVRSTAV